MDKMALASRKTFQLLIIVFGFMCLVTSYASAKRVALVIGTDKYQNVPILQKAVNDARAITETLSNIGFEVIKGENLTRRQMNRSLANLERTISPGDQVFFFFAGHGVALGATNYLIPADMPLPDAGEESLVRGEAFAVDQIVERIQASGAIASFVVLDACRNNPFKTKGVRSIGSTRGLRDISAPKGVFVLFSAGIGQTALDRLHDNDSNPNSVFTRNLVPLLKQPGLSHVQLAKRVQSDVDKLARTIRHEQQPAYYDQVIGNMFLLEGKKKVAVLQSKKETSTAASVKQNTSPNDQAEKFYNQVIGSDSIALLRAFSTRFPDSFYATLAKAKIAELEKTKNRNEHNNREQKTIKTEAANLIRKKSFFPTNSTRKCDQLAGSTGDNNSRVTGVVLSTLTATSSDAIAACKAAILEFPNEPTLQFQLGRALIAGKAYQEAKLWLNKAVDQDYAAAQNAIGLLYANGWGFPKDNKLAIQWFRKAADQGSKFAQSNLGVIYAFGIGVAVDHELAVHWYRKSAAQGFARAQFLLGDKYRTGKGVIRDYKLAVQWYSKAAEQGNVEAQFNVGKMYEQGKGVIKDDKVAVQWIIKSVAQNHKFGITQLKDHPLTWSKSFRVALHHALRSKGYYFGLLDGNFGPGTKKAIDKLAANGG